MSFDTRGKEDIEAFAAKMDAQLNIVSIPYDEDNQVTNGIRAEHLLKALLPWLEQKIREQGRPYRCDHEQWCLGRVLEKTCLILLAQVVYLREEYKDKKREEKKSFREERKPFGNYRKDKEPYRKEEQFRYSPKFKKLSKMTTEEKNKMRADNICFFY